MSAAELIEEVRRLRNELDAQQAQAEAQGVELTESHIALEQHAQRYARLYDQAPIGYLTLDDQGLIEQINPAAAAMLGTERPRAAGWPLRGFVLDRDRRKLLDYLFQCRGASQPVVTEITLSPRRGGPATAQLVTRVADDDHRFHTAMIDITQRRRAESALHLRENQLSRANTELQQHAREAEQRAAQVRALAAELTNAEQRERRHLAGLLHDHLQQLLVGAKMHLGLIHSRDTRALKQIKDLLDQSIEASRSLAAELSPPVLYDAGLAAALGWLGRWMANKHHLTVHIQCDDAAQPEGDDVLALLFSAVRELLFNVVKHGETAEAWVTMERDDQRVRIVVEDAGKGFDPLDAAQPQRASYGLSHMRERLNLIGGEMRIQSQPARGTTTTILAPLHSGEQTPLPAGNASPPPGPPEPLENPDRAGAEPTSPPGPADPPRPIRLLLVDDHEVVRKGFAMMFQAHPDLLVVAEAADGQEAIEQASEHQPDVIIMDVNMPGMGGIEATRQLSERVPRARILGLSMHQQEEFAQSMRDAGARAYFAKDAPPDELLAAIRQASPPPAAQP